MFEIEPSDNEYRKISFSSPIVKFYHSLLVKLCVGNLTYFQLIVGKP